jgi:hypothetical protein
LIHGLHVPGVNLVHLLKRHLGHLVLLRAGPLPPIAEEIIIGYIGELGRHPEIIAQTIEVSNRAKLSAVRPIKAKLARLDKEFLDASREVQSCVEAAKKKGAGTSQMPSSRRPKPLRRGGTNWTSSGRSCGLTCSIESRW